MRNKGKFVIAAILLALLVAVFGYSLYRLLAQYTEEKREKDRFLAITEQVRAVAEDVVTADPSESAPYPLPVVSQSDAEAEQQEAERTVLPSYASVYEQNPDLFGWIRIAGTPIDYPVMYTPKDPDYYLHRDFYGNDSKSDLDNDLLPVGRKGICVRDLYIILFSGIFFFFDGFFRCIVAVFAYSIISVFVISVIFIGVVFCVTVFNGFITGFVSGVFFIGGNADGVAFFIDFFNVFLFHKVITSNKAIFYHAVAIIAS